eukprot:gene465-3798_t
MSDEVQNSSDIQVVIKMLSGRSFTISCPPNVTTAQLKELIQPEANIPVDQQRLVYSGKILKDSDELQARGFKSGHTLHVVSTPKRTSAPPPQPFQPTSQAPASSSSSFSSASPASSPQADPFAQLLQSPAMQQMMSNPEFMESMMMNNPQMRGIMESNPDLRNALRDPELMQRTMRMMTNPSLRQEFFRQQDRAISNLESMPGGFQFLQQMNRDVIDPMYNAFQQSDGNNEEDEELNPFDELFRADTNSDQRPNSEALPNPWSSSSPQSSSTISAPSRRSCRNCTHKDCNAHHSNPFANPFRSGAATSTSQASSSSSPTSVNGLSSFPGAIPGLGNSSMMTPQHLNMLESFLSMPGADEMLQQAFNSEMLSDPSLRDHPVIGPQLRMLQSNPELLRAMSDPETMRQSIAIARQSLAQGPGTTYGQQSSPDGSTQPSQEQGLPSWLSSFINQSQLSTPATAGDTALPQPQQHERQHQNPASRFASQLQSLHEMGFTDDTANLAALSASNGNVHLAVQRLLEQS